MSGSPVFESAWRLLKDYDFVGHLPQEYYSTLPDRMAQLIESGDTLEHVNLVPTDHYNKRIRQRYNSDQALPPEFQKRGMKKYRFTLEAILNFMANDLARNHPELLETMSEPKRAGDPKYPDMPPSMMFDAMYTDDPKVDESEKRRGLSHRVSPHFVLNDEGKLQLATVGHGKLSDKKKQNIQVVPTTSLLNDMHDNSAIDERLPNRFDFLDRGNPDMPEMPVEEESPLPQTFSPQEKDYSNLPPAYREAARLADEQKNASEPMDIAMRLLKRDLSEMTDYEIDRARFANDNTELQSEERTRAMDRMAEYARMNHPPAYALEEMFGEQVADAHDKVGDYDHADYFGDSIDPNEMHQYILENAGEEAAQNYINMYRMYRSQYGGNQASMSQLDQYGLKNDRDLNDFVENRESLTEDLDSIMPSDESVFDAFPYPEGTEFINHLSPPFTSTPENESNFQMKYTSEPMDIAMRLLKNFVLDPDHPERAYFRSSMGYLPDGKVGYVPNTEVDHLNDVKINLAHPGNWVHRDRDGNHVDYGFGFDQFVQRLNKDMLHEHTHAAIDGEIRQAYKDKILPSENVFSAHEVGAIAAQNPGEEFANQRGADRVSENETQHHPSTRDWRAEQSPFADGRWSPQPAYSSNSEEGWE